MDKKCPTTYTEWTQEANSKQCPPGTNYHCNKDEEEKFHDYCLARTWIQPGHCPEYNTKANKIDVILCSDRFGKCPIQTYWSDEVYQYSACYSKPIANVTTTTAPVVEPTANFPFAVVIALVGVFVFAAILIGLLVLCYCRRKARRYKDHGLLQEYHFPGDQSCNVSSREPPLLTCWTATGNSNELEVQDFIDTNTLSDGKHVLRSRRVLVYVGERGSGKSYTSLKILEELMDDITDVKIFTSIEQLEDKPNTGRTSMCYLLDDCFGRWYIDPKDLNERIDKLEGIINTLREQNEHISLIITVPSVIWQTQEHIFNRKELFNVKNVVRIRSPRREEKQSMLSSYMQEYNMKECMTSREESYSDVSLLDKINEVRLSKSTIGNILDINTDISGSIAFPEACYLFCRERRLTMKGVAFFQNPRMAIKSFLKERLADGDDVLKYCALVYGLFQGGTFDTRNINNELIRAMKSVLELKDLVENRVWDSVRLLKHVYLDVEKDNCEGHAKKPHFVITVKQNCILECVYMSLSTEQCAKLSQAAKPSGIIKELELYRETL